MLVINTKRVYTLNHKTEEGEEFSVTFKFKHSEDYDWRELRNAIKDIKDEEESRGRAVDSLIRSSIVGTDIVDADTMQPVALVDVPEDVLINNQKAIMDIVKMYPDFYLEVLSAYMGPKGKNLKTGVTEQLTGAGDQASV